MREALDSNNNNKNPPKNHTHTKQKMDSDWALYGLKIEARLAIIHALKSGVGGARL